MAMEAKRKESLSAEFWAIISVGVAILVLGWFAFSNLDRKVDDLRVDMADVKERLANIEGWIQGRFKEGGE